MGVLPAPPLPLTTATVRGPRQWADTAAASARCSSSVDEGDRCSPTWLTAPRQPVDAGDCLAVSGGGAGASADATGGRIPLAILRSSGGPAPSASGRAGPPNAVGAEASRPPRSRRSLRRRPRLLGSISAEADAVRAVAAGTGSGTYMIGPVGSASPAGSAGPIGVETAGGDAGAAGPAATGTGDDADDGTAGGGGGGGGRGRLGV